ncbi:ribonuclease Z [Flavobacterium silvaticum]|uniref:Ribonuclease Z n=1 Tax=Flavobacterium silvaticum TaxID=1852020 RepID=A0A972FP35_9FLAO|nr:ribonuclease Z [Flavobacterium silvaticum]NMH28810.1 ribonuclease Z [Flavobacterium silvaticum]
MKVETHNNTCIIRDNQSDLTNFLMKLTHEFKTFEKYHVIIDVSSHGRITVKQANSFLPLSNSHRKTKKSFVVVTDTDFNATSAKLALVPTIQEAHDVIELEEIERDLGI